MMFYMKTALLYPSHMNQLIDKKHVSLFISADCLQAAVSIDFFGIYLYSFRYVRLLPDSRQQSST
jgi:hypothetical protein